MMNKFLKFAGFLIAGFGLLVLIGGDSSGVVPGIIFISVGVATIYFRQLATAVSKKQARKELMELKTLLDNGILTSEEYDEKSKALKSKL